MQQKVFLTGWFRLIHFFSDMKPKEVRLSVSAAVNSTYFLALSVVLKRFLQEREGGHVKVKWLPYQQKMPCKNVCQCKHESWLINIKCVCVFRGVRAWRGGPQHLSLHSLQHCNTPTWVKAFDLRAFWLFNISIEIAEWICIIKKKNERLKCEDWPFFKFIKKFMRKQMTVPLQRDRQRLVRFTHCCYNWPTLHYCSYITHAVFLTGLKKKNSFTQIT